ncbi:MAG: cation:proton antiporter [Planctomycetota bacterium]
MILDPLLGLAAVIALGAAAQWLGWRLRFPSILLLLLVGVAAGPAGSGLIDADELFGKLLFPIVSLSVALILFEGGLSLRVRELGEHGGVVRRLVTRGAAATWALTAAAAHVLLGLSLELAILLGAILTVTGPTVVLPLLRQIRPTGGAGSVLKWEGIVIDPIGAVLAVLVFEGIAAGGVGEATRGTLKGIAATAVIGAGLGVVAAWALLLLLRRYWVPDHLHSPVALAMAVAAFAAANELQNEAGLLAVTLMGVLVANQQRVSTRHILEFKENLRVLLLASLFILLAARLQPEDLAELDLGLTAFLVILVGAARPLAVWLSTRGAGLTRAECLFVAWMAPRGIVAAAVASVFALRLEELHYAGAHRLVPLTFLVILATVAVYGLTAGPFARRLGVAVPDPQGVLVVGAHSWARELAAALQTAGVPVLVADTNPQHVAASRMGGLRTYAGSPLADRADDEIDLQGIGRLFALTPNDEVNALTALHYAHLFGRREVYQLAPAADTAPRSEPIAASLRGRLLFGPGRDYVALSARFAAGARVKATRLTGQFDFEAWRGHYGEDAIPLLTIEDESGRLLVATADQPVEPEPGQTLIGLVEEPPPAAA